MSSKTAAVLAPKSKSATRSAGSAKIWSRGLVASPVARRVNESLSIPSSQGRFRYRGSTMPQIVEEHRKFFEIELLESVRERLVRPVVDLDHETVRPHGQRGLRAGQHDVLSAERMAQVHDHGERDLLFQEWNGRDVEREPGGPLERADAALAEDHAIIAAGQDVLRREEQLLEGRHECALQEDRLADAADGFEQLRVVHVS